MYNPDEIFPPDKYIKIKKVAIFDEHESTGAGGKPKKITVDDLKRFAKHGNEKFDNLGVATPLVLGHSKDDADEKDQPDLVGWCVKYQVDKLANTDRKALYTDWYIKKKFEHVIDDYPFRSVELWLSRNDIQPVSLLKTAPERDLPIIRYNKSPDDTESVYRYTFTPSNKVNPTEPITMDENEKTDVANAVADETSSSKQLAADLASVKEQVSNLASMMQELMQALSAEESPEGEEQEPGVEKPEGGDDKDSDMLDKVDADGDGNDEDAEPEEDAEAPADGDAKKDDDEEAEQYSAMNAGPGNTFTPGMEKKTKMSRTNDDTVSKYERRVKTLENGIAVVVKENEELRSKFNRTQAEKTMGQLEKDHNIDFGTKEDYEEEAGLLTNLLTLDKTGKSFKEHCNKIVKKYKRKAAEAPNSDSVSNAMKYSRTPEDGDTKQFGSADDVQAFLKAYNADNSITPEQWAAKRSGKK